MVDPKQRCDWWRCTERASQIVVLPERTVAVCPEHTSRLAIAHRHGVRVETDPLHIPHPLAAGSVGDEKPPRSGG